MKIGMNATCLRCHFGKNMETAIALGDEEAALAFGKDLMRNYSKSSPKKQDIFLFFNIFFLLRQVFVTFGRYNVSTK